MRKLFGAEVKRRRTDLGLSQEQLAEQAELHRTYVSDVESGKRNPSLASIERLARALNASLASVFAALEREDQSQTPAAPAGNHSAKQPIDILLVEDKPVDVDLTLTAFRRAKLANPVTVAHDGAQALDFLFCRGPFANRRLENGPQIVLLDLNLPQVHGLDVLKRIKSHPRNGTIHVIVLTISRRDDHIDEALKLGAAAYIVKPVVFESLSEVTQRLDLGWALVNAT